MKNVLIIFSILFVALVFGHFIKKTNQGINPLLGDISFIEKFGYEPSDTTNENLRIKTHFDYVESLLRQKDISFLSADQQLKRRHILALLHTYAAAGIFPRNYDYTDKRIPCFIDRTGNICGVGYLVEQTAGRKTAEELNRKHQYKTISEMNDNILDNWIVENGLTKEECAMIQPTYAPAKNNNHISSAYGASSAFFNGVNLSLNVMNVIQISKGKKFNAVPVLSILTGASSILLGAYNIPAERGFGYRYTNESQKLLSFINIGFGSTTLVLGVCNLIANRKKKEKSVAWNIYNFTGPNNQKGFALGFTKKL